MEALTNWSINSKAKVLNMIHAQERIHWFYGLRECEMHKVRCEGELRPSKRELNNLIQRKKKEADFLSGFTGLILKNLMPNRFKNLGLDLSDLGREIDQINISIRDSQMQFDAAQNEFNRICQERKEYLSLPYEDLQDKYSEEALRRQQSVLIASRIFSAQRQLPPEVGEVLIGLSPQKREQVMRGAFELLNGCDFEEVSRQELIDSMQSIQMAERSGGENIYLQELRDNAL